MHYTLVSPAGFEPALSRFVAGCPVRLNDGDKEEQTATSSGQTAEDRGPAGPPSFFILYSSFFFNWCAGRDSNSHLIFRRETCSIQLHHRRVSPTGLEPASASLGKRGPSGWSTGTREADSNEQSANIRRLVRAGGLAPPWHQPPGSRPGASTSFATPAWKKH